ncbi:MAG: hypothetical protein ACNS62_25105 [Candidatus Cyclobacteriaceae bacterium M3_2C_046]
MHDIEPYYNWEKFYVVSQDPNSPYYGKQYDFNQYTDAIYGYYIDPAWDYIGSETLYIKILFVDYQRKFMVIEFIGEWNDALHNDIMHLKRNIIDHFCKYDINKFILIGENVLNFHGSDDCYYEEWFEDVEDGWVAALNFRDFVLDEMKKYNIDYYINFGGSLQLDKWRTLTPVKLYELVDRLITRRISLF